jgi:acetyltransferase-like isoleucine patch superfamily enzyme
VTRGLDLDHDWYPEPLPGNVTIGERSWLYSSFAFLHHESRRSSSVTVGRDSGVYHQTFFDLGPDARVEIGDYCAIAGPIFSTNGRIVVGDYAFVSYGVVLADSPTAVPPRSSAHRVPSDPSIVLEDNVWIGVRAIVLGGAHIGEGAIVGAAAVVDFEVPPYAIVAGNPAGVIGHSPPR